MKNVLEIFSGSGGMALGFEKAGFHHTLLNDNNKDCCSTLRTNRPHWNVIESDVRNFDFKPYSDKVDVVAGGFPCQSFSYAGNKKGFEDPRGSLFWEYSRVVNETKPLVALAENVKGLLTHDGGQTLKTMMGVMQMVGYDNVFCEVLNAVEHGVPQKRERLIMAWVRRNVHKHTPKPFAIGKSDKILTLRDALKGVPASEGAKYPDGKAHVLSMVPPGGCWRDLPHEVAKAYMGASWTQVGGKTGMARRMSWGEPSLTILTTASQKQTERCHPDETRPFTVRESARIQTFPDDWDFDGSLSSQYRQIGNAVPVEMSHRIANAVKDFLKGL